MKLSTREKAVESARTLMLSKGKDGVRMQEIADHAGINKGLLHYYFKNKDTLFKEVILEEIQVLFAQIETILNSDIIIEDKVSAMIDHYFNALSNQGKRSSFVLFEINKDPKLVKETGADSAFTAAVDSFDKALKFHGLISSPQYAFQVMMNIISLCVFPFMSDPLSRDFYKTNKTDGRSLMNQRREFLKNLIIGSLRT